METRRRSTFMHSGVSNTATNGASQPQGTHSLVLAESVHQPPQELGISPRKSSDRMVHIVQDSADAWSVMER